MTCYNCEYNDGFIYTSNPPKYRCTISGEWHFSTYNCDIKFAPVKHGRWIKEKSVGDCCYKCSECGFIRDAYLLEVDNYCPNCGARMDEGANL